ncbi:MAG: hypothetical protein RLZZ352_2377 [Pseudomonadota bacterium]
MARWLVTACWVDSALRDVVQTAGLDWEQVGASLKRDGRLHLETY